MDDEEAVRRLLARLLERSGYSCEVAGNAAEAEALLAKEDFDLLLTDMDMPGDSGLHLIRSSSTKYPELATVMVTGLDDTALATSALALGAYGYIFKPFESNEILINVSNALLRRSLEIENRSQQQRLERMVEERTAELWNAMRDLESTQEELRRSRAETIRRLSIAAEFRDDETGKAHSTHEPVLCAAGSRTGSGLRARRTHPRGESDARHWQARHPDNILQKPGKLTPDERAVMQRHCEIGWRILSGSHSELLDLAGIIALSHHERVDGTGYPHGLSGSDIPFEGRIVAVADVFDALTTDRVYRPALPLGRALNIMRDGKGTHFDVEALEAFFGALDDVIRIHEELAGH